MTLELKWVNYSITNIFVNDIILSSLILKSIGMSFMIHGYKKFLCYIIYPIYESYLDLS